MNIDYTIVAIISVALIAIIFLIVRNLKDEKKLVKDSHHDRPRRGKSSEDQKDNLVV